MSLSRLVSLKSSNGVGARASSRLSWRTIALFGVPLGLTGLALYIYYLKKHQEIKTDADPIPETPLEATLALKLRGNKFFKGGHYQQAIKLYEEGLEQCPAEALQERAALYQNLAAAKENLHQYESAIVDCTSALQLSPKYLKALNRRAHLYEKLEKWDECLLDVTACCIFEKFKNADNIVTLDQVLKKIGQLKAAQERSKMSCELPSAAFIRNYLSAFAWDPFANVPPTKSKSANPESTNGTSDLPKSNLKSHQSDSPRIDINKLKDPAKSAQLEWNQALDSMTKGDYEHSMVAVTKAVSLFEAALKDPSCFELVESNIVQTAGAGEEIKLDQEKSVNGTIDLHPDDQSNETSEDQEISSSPQTVQSATEHVVAQGESESTRLSTDVVRAFIKASYDKAALLYATYLALAGRSEEAKQRFQTLGTEDWGASPTVRVNALIKAACLSMSVDQDVAACLYDFQRAQGACPECPDVYLHRGQINLLADQLDEALHDLNTAVKLKPEFSVAQAQRLYTLYRVALTSSDMSRVDARVEEFRRLVKKYPNCLETHSLFAQILTERGDFEEGDKEFAEVLALAPDSGLAYAHRGLLQLRWKQDREAAFRWFTQGAKADPKCELIHELLGQLAVESGHYTKALEHFDLAIRQAKTQNDLAHFISLREGVNAQLRVCQQNDISIPEVLSNLQREQQNFFMAMQQ